MQAEVFEEIATMDHPFEGIPTVPPRRNTTHMAAFCNGCRYRVTASPDMTVAEVSWCHTHTQPPQCTAAPDGSSAGFLLAGVQLCAAATAAGFACLQGRLLSAGGARSGCYCCQQLVATTQLSNLCCWVDNAAGCFHCAAEAGAVGWRHCSLPQGTWQQQQQQPWTQGLDRHGGCEEGQAAARLPFASSQQQCHFMLDFRRTLKHYGVCVSLCPPPLSLYCVCCRRCSMRCR